MLLLKSLPTILRQSCNKYKYFTTCLCLKFSQKDPKGCFEMPFGFFFALFSFFILPSIMGNTAAVPARYHSTQIGLVNAQMKSGRLFAFPLSLPLLEKNAFSASVKTFSKAGPNLYVISALTKPASSISASA